MIVNNVTDTKISQLQKICINEANQEGKENVKREPEIHQREISHSIVVLG